MFSCPRGAWFVSSKQCDSFAEGKVQPSIEGAAAFCSLWFGCVSDWVQSGSEITGLIRNEHRGSHRSHSEALGGGILQQYYTVLLLIVILCFFLIDTLDSVSSLFLMLVTQVKAASVGPWASSGWHAAGSSAACCRSRQPLEIRFIPSADFVPWVSRGGQVTSATWYNC